MTAAAPGPARVLAYRPEIDGLRALAVLSVLFFHAQLGPLTGGFAGVDVFFVLSGFLITGILLGEQQQGIFSLAGFYARRARRLGPALLCVCVACVPAALALMNGPELRDFARMLAATAVGGSNVLLAGSTGYFDLRTEDRPLLHTWSLAVEEQFYLVFPLLLLAAARWPRRRLALVLAGLALLSLALAEWGWRRHTSATFFLPHGRVWELLVGALCAMASARAATLARGPRQWLAAAGLAAVLASFVLFDSRTPAPSAWLLVPVLGTAAVLLWGAADTVCGRLLASRPLVAVGLVSYSAYLWHQPLLAFARLHLDAPLPASWRWAAIAMTLVLAALSWKYVEQPFRHAPAGGRRRTLGVAAAASCACLAAGVAGAQLAGGIAPPLPAAVRAAMQPPPRTEACFDVEGAHEQAHAWCQVNAGAEARPSFMLFGDSHALQLLEAFEQAAGAAGRSGVFTGFSACPPLLEVVALTRPDGQRLDCEALNRRVLAHVREAGIRDIYLVGKWSYYTERWNGGRYLAALGLRRGEPRSVESSRRAFAAGYAATVRAYAALGVQVHVLEQVPQQLYEAPVVYERAAQAGAQAQEVIAHWSVPLARHRALQAFPRAVLRDPGLPPREVLNFDDLFCDGARCLAGTPEQPWYSDLSHLSAAGADRLVPRLAASLRQGPLAARAEVPE